MLRGKTIPVAHTRELFLGVTSENSSFPSNYISTTRYDPLTFIPLCVFNQFKRYANIYFLVSAILQSIPLISPLNPISAIAPLLFVISLSVIREGYEDLQRYKSDIETNGLKTMRYEDDRWRELRWADLKVGDIVRIDNGQFFPADIALLASSDPKGSCFIMTSPLDGEKNLKPRFAIAETQELISMRKEIRLLGRLSWPDPSPDLGEFSAKFELSGEKAHFFTAKQLLLRGAQLSNTDSVLGVVVYTGKETKIMNNSDNPSQKLSQIEAMTNRLIIVIIGIQLLLCVVIGVGSFVWNHVYAETYSEFIRVRTSPIIEGVLSFFTMWILLNTMIPISLIISLEMVKLVQASFINKDLDMYCAKERKFAKAFSSTLNEELGQIEYIFTDKTGTLTCNQMEFKYCQIGGSFFGDKGFLTEAGPSKVISRFADPSLTSMITTEDPGKPLSLSLKDSKGREELRVSSTSQLAHYFLLCLSLCHDCLLDKGEYVGPSPDEVALVETARQLGYAFVRSTNTGKIVEINGEETEIEVLGTFEFDSARKRASIVVRLEGKILLLCKGADSVIIDRLNGSVFQEHLEDTKALLSKFSVAGLRTLAFGLRAFEASEWADLSARLASAQAERAEERAAEITDLIEKDLMLMGVTAVEDRLQDQVPEVIADFIQANIKVWMLTGDKLETAENIGYSCKLIQSDFKKLYLDSEKRLRDKLEEMTKILASREPTERFCLIAEGKAILRLSQDKELAQRFVEEVFSQCNSVVCCRMSPKQKGEVVRLIKNFMKKITLAIGDGANDCNMIQEAHIGIGLYGKEGMRAVQSSDYALPEFKALWRLLFVHGRWSYIRISEMILYFYYKNIVFSIPMFFFGFLNRFSAQTIYDDFYIAFYNLAFTSAPVMVRAILDQDIYFKAWRSSMQELPSESEEVKQFYPHLYHVGQQNLIFNFANINIWLLKGLLSAGFIFLAAYFTFCKGVAGSGGQNVDLWFFSIVVYSCVIVVSSSDGRRQDLHLHSQHDLAFLRLDHGALRPAVHRLLLPRGSLRRIQNLQKRIQRPQLALILPASPASPGRHDHRRRVHPHHGARGEDPAVLDVPLDRRKRETERRKSQGLLKTREQSQAPHFWKIYLMFLISDVLASPPK